MKIAIIILSIVTGCLILLAIYVNLSETNYTERTKSIFLVTSCTLLLLTTVLQNFQKKKENGSS